MSLTSQQESPTPVAAVFKPREALLSMLAAASVSTIPGLDFVDAEHAAAWAGFGLNAAARAVCFKNLRFNLRLQNLSAIKSSRKNMFYFSGGF